MTTHPERLNGVTASLLMLVMGAAAWGVIILLAMAAFNLVHAETYVGAGASLAIVDLETNCEGCTTYDNHKVSLKPEAFVGYRYRNLAVEGGLGYASFRSHAILPSRPADMRQEIDSRYLYVSGLQFFPLLRGEVFLGAGVAQVKASNYEHGLNRDDTTNVPAHYMENRTWTKEIAPYFQVGYQWEGLRVGVSFIPNVVRSVWTKQEDIWSPYVAYVWRFK